MNVGCVRLLFTTIVVWMCPVFSLTTSEAATKSTLVTTDLPTPTATLRTESEEDVAETTTPVVLHSVQMGKGLQTIPLGNPYTKSVNFGYNRISALTSYVFYFNGYVSLTKIELCQNKIANVSQKAFKELTQLKMVDLSGNNLTYLEISTFRSNTKLAKLDLSHNKLSFVPHKPFLNSPSLETLMLSNNKIDQIYEATFGKLPKLRNVMLNDNSMFFIEANSFAPLKSLQLLSLANTGVFRLSENMFNNESYPRIIDLTGTPLANKFDPPLKKVKSSGVANLLTLDRYF